MRIHEVLEACVEYVAYEGVLGTDVLSLQRHLAKRDASLDATSFAYLYTLLCQHPSILISISTYPLPSADRTIQLGIAPLPADYAPPDEAREVDFDRLYREGKRGRELAYHLAGEEHLTSRQAVEAKRVEQERIRLEKLTGKYYETEQAASKGKVKRKKGLEQVVGEDGTILFTVLEDDDAELGGEAVDKTDLAGLAEKWGSRLRIRCTDDEIYFRLTGSHQKIPKLSAVVLHTLALAARARERGITAIELGPMVGASQGSMHYYMKVLVETGLCAKVPAVLHGSITNLLLFHPFLELNENYRAIKKLGPLPVAAAVPVPEMDQAGPSGTTTLAGVEDDDHDSTVDDEGGSGATGYDFGPMTEQELMTGHVVKERLIQLLEHPALQNHLLKSKNLLGILGWKSVSALRHRRAIPRHIASLVMDGVIERLEVGPKRIDVLRLTKYNPKYTGPPKPAVNAKEAEETSDQVILYTPGDFSEKYNQLGGIALNRSFERQINDVVIASGQTGALYSDVRAGMAQAYKRSIEFHLVRAEETRVPPQLRESAIASLMENYRRERRLRVFTIEDYRAFLVSQGQVPDDKQFPPLTAEAGRWCDIDYRSFATDLQTFWKRAERVFDLKEAQTSVIPPPKKVQKIRDAEELKSRKRRADSGKRKPRDEAGKIIPPKNTRKRAVSPGSDEEDGVFRSKPKYYDNEIQQRGRPRKYIQVVDEEGKVNRLIVGQIIPNPKLPLVLIFVISANKLVPAPEGYTGVGKPPPVTAEQLKKGHPPEWFKSFPKANKYPGKEKKKAEARKSGKGKEKETMEMEDQPDEEGEEKEDEQVVVEEDELVDGKDDEVVDKTQDQLVDEKDDEAIPIDEDEPADAGPVPLGQVAPVPEVEVGSSAVPKKRARQSKVPWVVAEEQPAKKRKPTKQTAGKEASAERSARAKSTSRSAKSPTVPIGPLPTGDYDGFTSASIAETARRAVTPLLPITDSNTQGKLPTDEAASSASKMRKDKEKQSFTSQTGSRAKKARTNGVAESRSSMTPVNDITRGSKEPSLSRRTPTSPVATMPPGPSAGRSQTITEHLPVDVSRTASKTAQPPSSPETSRRHKPPEIGGRVDLALVRRNNELCEALREYGGVLSDTRFLSAHREWAARVAGTDAPAAPAAAYSMDRRIFKLSLPVLETEGRIKMTTCAIPTTTGRWIQQMVIWLTDTPKAEVDRYISNLTQMTLNALTLPVKKGRVQIEDQAFSEARPIGGPGTSAKATVIKPSMRQDTPSTLRRNALIRQPGVGATLLGYVSGRWVRVQRFLEALLGAMEDDAASTSRVSTSPKVFTLPLIFEDIPVGTFYQCIFSTTYDEELDEWLQNPENQKIRLKNVPEKFRPERGGFAGGKAKIKYRTILTTLWQLGIISPLIPCPAADADLTVSGSDGDKSFKITAAVNSATHFIIHDFAPVYHLAVDTAGLLGILPIMQADEREIFWSATRDACVKENINELRPIEGRTTIGLPQTARITEKLELDLDLLKLMRSNARWKDEVRILPEQRQAIDQQVDWRQGVAKITSDEEIERFAYENALAAPYVRAELARRATQARDRASAIAMREATAAKDLKERREKNQRSLRQKLAEMRQESKKAWEERIMKAAEIAGIPYTQEMVNFVTHHTLSVPNRAKLGDKAIEDAVRLSLKVNQTRAAALGKQTVKTAEKPKLQYTLPPIKTVHHRGQRRRHHWTPEDDDLLLDAEAVLRARARGKQRGRAAMSQVFPDVGHQSILNRFKKVVAENGKQAYYDRLEQAWYDLWMYHRGSAELRDEDPDDTSRFDLRHHIEFLRTHIRKSDLRLGITTTTEIVHAKVPDLPADHDVLLQTQQWRYNKTEQTTMQQVTDHIVGEEAKERAYATVAYRDEGNDAQNGFSRERGILRAGLKMVTATPVETYHPAAAKLFIDHFSAYDLTPEITSLVDEKILIKQHNAAHTSRAHAFTALWTSASEGLFPAEMDKEAAAIKEALKSNKEGIEWSAVCAGGDIAALLEMASDGIVDIDFDPETIPVRALKNTYNTRVLDDDAFEFKFRVIPCAEIPAPHQPIVARPEAGPSNHLWTGANFDDEETHLAVNNVLDLVHAAGPDGVTRTELQEKTNFDTPLLSAVFASLAADVPPETFWAGCDESRLVSAEHWKAWTHPAERRVDEKGKSTGQPSVGRVRPRRWVDIYGGITHDDWERCLRNVAGQVATRPGILEVNLRTKVGILLDRMEMNEVIQYLVDKGTLIRAWVSDGRRDVLPPIEAMSIEDEGQVAYWSDKAFSS